MNGTSRPCQDDGPPAPGFILAAGSTEISAADAADLRARFREAVSPGRLRLAAQPGEHGPGCACQGCQARQVLAVTGEPLGLPDQDLPPYGKPDEGCCKTCLRGPLYGEHDICLYCWSLLREKGRLAGLQAQRGERHHATAPGHVPCRCPSCRSTRARRRILAVAGATAWIVTGVIMTILLAWILGGGS